MAANTNSGKRSSSPARRVASASSSAPAVSASPSSSPAQPASSPGLASLFWDLPLLLPLLLVMLLLLLALLLMTLHVALATAFAYVRTYDTGPSPSAARRSVFFMCMFERYVQKQVFFTPCCGVALAEGAPTL